MKIALQRLLFVMPVQAGIHVPAPGFRLGGRNDGGRGPVFIALLRKAIVMPSPPRMSLP